MAETQQGSPGPSRPGTALSRVSGAGTQGQIVKAKEEAATSQLQIQVRCQVLFYLQDDKMHLLDDAQVSNVVQFVAGLQDFMKQYVDGKEKIPPQMLQTPLQKIEGLRVPEDKKTQKRYDEVKAFNCQQLGETLFSDNKANGTSFCISIMHFQRLANGTYFDKLDQIFALEAAAGGESPIPMQEFVLVLPLNELTKNVVDMTLTTANSTWMSDLYLGNILNKLNSGEKGKNLAEEVQQLGQEVAKLNESIIQCKWDSDQFNGDKEQVLNNIERMQLMIKEGGNMRGYFEAELDKVTKLLSQAEADEKNYTYRCYGPFSFVFQNDVDLAKQKVSRYAAQKEQLETKKRAALGEENQLRKDEEKKNFCKELATAQASIEQCAEKIAYYKKMLEEKEKIRGAKLRNLVKLMKANGCESVDEMLNAMDAMKAVGQASSTQSQTGTVVLEGWIKDLNYLGVGLNRIARAKSFQAQQKMLDVLKKWVLQEDNLFCEFLRSIKPLTNIPFLKNREPYQRTNLPLMDCDEIAKDIDWSEKPMPAIEQPGWIDEPPPVARVEEICETLMNAEGPLAAQLPPAEYQMQEAAVAEGSGYADLSPPDDFEGEW